MNIGKLNWDTVERLRRTFIEAAPAGGDYWRSQEDLDVYDRTFGRRIAWKWDFVMAELARLNWQPPAGVVLDWGCGSGVAGRAFFRSMEKLSGRVERISGEDFELVLQDKSIVATQAALKFSRRDLPGLKVSDGPSLPDRLDVLLVSHVINELSDEQLQGLLSLARKATAVIWIEPGTRQAGRALSAVRDSLRDEFATVAPCTHQGICPMLEAQNERHWCHHFAQPPAEIFGSAEWVKFGRQAGIDLRSLPVSYLVMDKRTKMGAVAAESAATLKAAGSPAREGGDEPQNSHAGETPAPQDGHAGRGTRVIGRPRVYGAYAMILGCNAGGLAERRLMKRHLPEQFKLLRKGRFDALQYWRCEGIDVIEMTDC